MGFDKNYPFSFPEPKNSRVPLNSLLERHEKVDKKHFVSDYIKKKRLEKVRGKNIPVPSIWHENKRGDIGVHDFSCALRASASYNYLLVDGIRRLTPRENLNLQGFPKNFKMIVPDGQIRKQAGNAVPVPMIREVAKQMIEAISQEPLPTKLKTSPVLVKGQLIDVIMHGK